MSSVSFYLFVSFYSCVSCSLFLLVCVLLRGVNVRKKSDIFLLLNIRSRLTLRGRWRGGHSSWLLKVRDKDVRKAGESDGVAVMMMECNVHVWMMC